MRTPMAGGLRVAVAGCGYWGSKHVRVLHAADGVDELVLVDGREDRLLSLSPSYKVSRCYPALGSALEHIDAVVVATPPSTHVPLALAAIRAGKHVLVEKPLAPTSAGARTLVTAAAAAGVVLMVGHTFEYNPAVRKLAELVRYRGTRRAVLPRQCPAQPRAVPERRQRHSRSCPARRLHHQLRAGPQAGRGPGMGLPARSPAARGRGLPAPVLRRLSR